MKREAQDPDVQICRPVEVEFYSGYKEAESPRAVVLAGSRLLVTDIRGRERVRDSDSGRIAEIFDCRLEDGRTAVIERIEGGASKVRLLGFKK